MRNIRLVLEYEGTDHVGWQRQAQPNSVQQVVEEAIQRVTGEQVALTAASRTDAGVHARGQVANFATGTTLPARELRNAINALTPLDIAVLSADDAPEDFNARFHASGKRYEYTISTRDVPPAIGRRYCLHCRWPLNAEDMRRAAGALIGTHDFAAFASSGRNSGSTVRTLTLCDILESDETVVVAVEGDGFLYNMVRAVAGTLIDIGRGKIAAERMREILASRDRRQAGRTAPARGLCMMWVSYQEGKSP